MPIDNYTQYADLTKLCANKFRAYRTAYVPDEYLKCRNSCNPETCEDFILLHTQEPLRQGINALVLSRMESLL